MYMPDAMASCASTDGLVYLVTANEGDAPNHDVICSYGARSLTIRDTSGNEVFDCGSQIARMLEQRSPAKFKSNGLANSFDGKSNDKGAESEAVALGKLKGRYYAFLGLEHAGGIVVFDITHPEKARLVGYFNNANADGRPADAGGQRD